MRRPTVGDQCPLAFWFANVGLALVLTRQREAASLQTLNEADLPVGDVTIEVLFSSLNHKDGLAVRE